MTPRAAPLLVTILAVTACSPPVLPAAMQRAEELERAGRLDEALAAYRQERRLCGKAPARCGAAALSEARLLERMGRRDEALAAYEAVPRVDPHGRTPARALVRAARLADRQGLHARALAHAWRAVRTYPHTAPAEDAVRFIVVRMRRQGRAPALAQQLAAAARELHRSEVADNLLFWLGEVTATDLGATAAAVQVWDRLAQEHPRSSLRDDGLWRGAKLLRQGGDARGAIRRLRGITSRRQVALFTGSYLSEHLDDALLLIGRIYRDDLGDYDHALHAFVDLRDHFESSTLRDDAQVEIARTHLARGDRAQCCEALVTLRRRFPESNLLRTDARRLGAKAGCP